MMSSVLSRLNCHAFKFYKHVKTPICKYNSISLKISPFRVSQTTLIHTTPRRQAIPPIVLLVLRPIAKFSAMIFGRTLRKWWQKLPQSERQKILSRIKGKQTQIAFGASIITGLGILFYIEHIEEEPLTKRKRFMLYTDEQMLSIAEIEFENQISLYETHIVPTSHPVYNRIVRVANRLLSANNTYERIKNMKWAVTVVDRPDVVNAFVLPHGKIIVFSGILQIASNDDQLAVVLAHEMSHAILGHMREALSQSIIFEVIFLIPLVVLWAMLPDIAALFSQWLSGRLADIIIHLPFNRAIEMEADVIGVELAARACYDIREAPVFWGKMAQISSSEEELEWLSTHPSHETRQLELSQLIPAAMGIRDLCKCPRLPPFSAAQVLHYQAKTS